MFCDICSASSFGLVGKVTAAIQPRQVVYRVAEHVVDLGFVNVLMTSSSGLVGRTTAVMQPRLWYTPVATCHQNSHQTEVHDVLGHPEYRLYSVERQASHNILYILYVQGIGNELK